MQRQNYMIELATPRGFRGAVFSHADVAAQRKMTRQLLRQFTAEIRPLKQRDPAMRIRKRPNAAMPLFLINTIPALRSPIGELKSVRSVNELKRLHLIR